MKEEKCGYSVAALVLGIISLIMVVSCCFTVFSFIPAIAGIVCAMIAKSRTIRFEDIALGGFICSIISLVLFLLLLIFGILFYQYANNGNMNSMINQYYDDSYGDDFQNRFPFSPEEEEDDVI